jgi:multicomponent Na+:H+ antiporter subunit A
MIVAFLAQLLVAVAAVTFLRSRAVVAARVGSVVLASVAVVSLVEGRGGDRRWETGWVPELGLMFSFHIDGFAVVMLALVAGLGALVLWYSSDYFPDHRAYAQFVALFLGFATAMSGLVASADLFTMFVFWELTSVTSFLLIGLNDESSKARAAALRALLVTGGGGLCLLAAVALLQIGAGTTTFTELVRTQPDGAKVTGAAVLALIGAFTKSAQFPFHFWLPGAMSAPTPVSAYLHSATMVKAGIVLLARLAPALSHIDIWRWAVVMAGGMTMILGGAKAVRQVDAKLLLAHSTVSQLGFLTVLMGLGVPGATYAGVAHLSAHAVFKAGLFMMVGAVDHATGTRRIDELNGLGRQMPLLAGASALLAASMAGLIPLYGFVTKEKALVALLDANEAGLAAGQVALVAVVVGSVLSAAYSVRLWRGVFSTRGGAQPPDVHHHVGVHLGAPIAAVTVLSIAGGVLAGTAGSLLKSPAKSLDPESTGKLVLWPGVNTALVVSLAVLVVGSFVGWRIPLRQLPSLVKFSGERAFDSAYAGTLTAAKKITIYTQSGSLLAYNMVIMAVVGAVVVFAFAMGSVPSTIDLIAAHSPLQAAVAVLGAVFAVGMTVTKQRFVAAILLGGVGYACAALFAIHGAPDLAVTQLLVESLIVVVFLLILTRLPRKYRAEAGWAPRWLRLMLSVGVGIAMAAFAVVVGSSRTSTSVGESFVDLSLPEGGGKNVVNVILVDFRALDTLGEITVLAVAALGVVNLVRMSQRRKRPVLDEAGAP